MIALTQEDRQDPKIAVAIMESICPSPRDRLLLIRQLLTSINFAKKISPNVWALTLFQDGFRLNVGTVEVMTFFGRSSKTQRKGFVDNIQLRVLLQGEIDENLGLEAHEAIYSAPYKSVPQPQFVYINNLEMLDGKLPEDKFRRLEYILSSFRPLHENFIDFAARTPGGKIRNSSSYSRTHSPGLYFYADSFVRSKLEIQNAERPEPLLEGNELIIQGIRYERNPIARKQCIVHYGTSCFVCGFNFGVTYGNSVENYIEVHHLTPIATLGEEYVIDPIRDLRPVCSNCHSVIHLRTPPYSIQEVKNMLHK
ncbi:MAG: HNH endonuclease [Burkholderiaceae bacterium]|jgi:hypothetical protein|nr:HNH endonuclease [Burkholderiaceae bacterium]